MYDCVLVRGEALGSKAVSSIRITIFFCTQNSSLWGNGGIFETFFEFRREIFRQKHKNIHEIESVLAEDV